jgi:hypothetical protein
VHVSEMDRILEKMSICRHLGRTQLNHWTRAFALASRRRAWRIGSV